MRLTPKYKIYKLTKSFPVKYPSRIFKFKRTKWKKIKIQLKKTIFFNYKNKIKFIYINLKKKSKRYWDKVKQNFKKGLVIKNDLYSQFDNHISKNDFKKNLKKYNPQSIFKTFVYLFIKPYFRIDILLANLKIFITSYQARQSINNKEIKVNKKIIFGNYFLKKGDVIEIKLKNIYSLTPTKKIINLFSKNNLFFSFVEYDFYTKKLVIVKSIEEITNSDCFFLNYKDLNIKQFKDFLK